MSRRPHLDPADCFDVAPVAGRHEAPGVYARRRYAVHEAAHGVLALALGLPLGRIALITDAPDVGGVCSTHDMSVEEALARARHPSPMRVSVLGGRDPIKTLLFLLGAGVAVELAVGFRWPWRGDGDDRRRARELAGDALHTTTDDPRVHRLIAQLLPAARMHVERHWAWIMAVAIALDGAGELTGAQVRALRPVKDRAKRGARRTVTPRQEIHA